VDDEIREIVMRGYESARQILESDRNAVRSLAEELLERESLDGDEIRHVLATCDVPRAAMEAAGRV
jgi:cell division protease FtsH